LCGSQLFGVSWHKDKGKWQVQIRIPGGKNFHECFDDEVAAGKKYDAVVRVSKGG
jgi:hypothetical protein